jgi:hypothetical protein
VLGEALLEIFCQTNVVMGRVQLGFQNVDLIK